MNTNSPQIWLNNLSIPKPEDNKYTRGHAVINGAELINGSTGASKLAAYAALRSGAGLVSIACSEKSAAIYATSMASVITKITNTPEEFYQLIEDKHVKTVLVGPGNDINAITKEKTLCSLSLKKNTVIDADAITVFENNPHELFNAINNDVILTPHTGEFTRLFPLSEDKIISTINAAKISGATILLKGSDTIIANPDGQYIINKNAPTNLASAGTGDVLAGLIAGFMAQGLSSFIAASIACYIHSEAARNIGMGLISEDLLPEISKILKQIYQKLYV